MTISPSMSKPPKVGSTMVRDDAAMGRFEALVVLVNTRRTGWEATLYTESGPESVTDQRMRAVVQVADWRPPNWKYNRAAGRFAPPNYSYDAETGAWSIDEKVDEDDQSEVTDLPDRSLLPEFKDGEHPNTWKARCRRKFPALKSDEGAMFLSGVYQQITQSE